MIIFSIGAQSVLAYNALQNTFKALGYSLEQGFDHTGQPVVRIKHYPDIVEALVFAANIVRTYKGLKDIIIVDDHYRCFKYNVYTTQTSKCQGMFVVSGRKPEGEHCMFGDKFYYILSLAR